MRTTGHCLPVSPTAPHLLDRNLPPFRSRSPVLLGDFLAALHQVLFFFGVYLAFRSSALHKGPSTDPLLDHHDD